MGTNSIAITSTIALLFFVKVMHNYYCITFWREYLYCYCITFFWSITKAIIAYNYRAIFDTSAEQSETHAEGVYQIQALVIDQKK